MHVNFISSKDTGETRTIYVWSNDTKIMWGSDKIISGSKSNFESIEQMDYKLHRVWLKRGRLYI